MSLAMCGRDGNGLQLQNVWLHFSRSAFVSSKNRLKLITVCFPLETHLISIVVAFCERRNLIIILQQF